MDDKQRFKAQLLLNKVQSGNFQFHDVDNLFMTLRQSSKELGFKNFNEVSHFVAHNHDRDRGPIKDLLDLPYYQIRILNEYNGNNRLNLSYFPIYINQFFKLQLAVIYKESEIEKKFSQKDASSLLDLIKEDKKLKMAGATVADPNLLTLCQDLIENIVIRPLTDNKTLINELTKLSIKIGLIVDEAAILKQSGKITMSILFLMHNTVFEVGGSQKGSVYIHEEPDLQTLEIRGRVPQSHGQPDVAFCIVQTDLKTSDWCEDSMYTTDPNGRRKFDPSGPVRINVESFKLYK